MSTKTTFKRIALVAVASLGFGMLSVAPSSAAAIVGTDIALTGTAGTNGITITAATAGTIVATTTSATPLSVGYRITAPSGAISYVGDDFANATVGTAAIASQVGTLTLATTFLVEAGKWSVSVVMDDANNAYDSQADIVTALATAANVVSSTFYVRTAGSYLVPTVYGGTSTANATGTAFTVTTSASTGGFVDLTGLESVTGASSLSLAVTGSTIALATAAFRKTSLLSDSTKAITNSTIAGSAVATTGVVTGGTLAAEDISADTTVANLACAAGTNASQSIFNVTSNNAIQHVCNSVDTLTIARVNDAVIAAANLVSADIGNASFRINTATAGTITATLSSTVITNGISVVTPLQTFTIIVSGGAAFSGNVTVTRAEAGTGQLMGNNQIYAPSTAGTTVGSIAVDAGTTATPSLHPSWVFTMTGVGVFSLDGGTTKVAYQAVPAGTAATATVNFFGDGRAGVGTLSISANGNVVASQAINFYGAAASIKVTPVYTIARAGDGLTGYELGAIDEVAVAGFAPATAINVSAAGVTANDPALVVEVLDALGTRLPIGIGSGLTMSSSNTAAISSTVTDSFLDAGVAGATAGALVNHVTFSSAPAAKSGDKANLTFSHINAAGTLISSTPLAVSVGGSRTGGKVTMTLDKTSYEAGEKMVLTLTALDAAGNKVYDGVATGALGSNKNVLGLAAGTYVDGKYVLGDEAGENLYAPAASGSFTITLASGTATGATVTVTATVGDDAATTAAAAAGDAAAEATDAANAATDAANAAAEAADAATAAAQDAADAVAALSTSVTAMVDALRKQITSLTNLVIKIQKKVRA